MALGSPATEEKKDGKKIGAFRAPQENFTRNHFIFGKLLGLGSYSKVVRVKKKDTGQEYALKVMDKRHIMRENKVQYVKMERLILDQLDHPGVTRLHFTFQDNMSLYMGMECCCGGELFDQIKRKGQLSHEEARFYAAEIVDAVEYIHSEGLIHRDLKPENILFTADGHLKIADFGSSKMLRSFTNGIITCDPDEKSCTFVGTAEYVAPEVLNSQPITPNVDMWALGCVIYQMLDGRPPFKAASEYLTFQKVMSRDFVMPEHFPPDAKDLINKLLNLVPEKRPDFVTIKKHPFFTGVSWTDLWKMSAPRLALPSSQAGDVWDLEQLRTDLEAFELSESSSESGSGCNSQSSSPNANACGEFSKSPSRRRRSSSPSAGAPSAVCAGNHTLTDDCTLQQWQRFLSPGEKLLGTSMVRRYSGMSTRRQQLLLTNKPRLAIVDLKKFTLKQEIPWSNNLKELYVDIEDHLRFSIHTPNLIWHFEDVRGLAHGWRGAIEKLQNERFGKPHKERLFDDERSIKIQEEPVESRQGPVDTGEPAQTQVKLQAQLKPEELLADIQATPLPDDQPVDNQNAESDSTQIELRHVYKEIQHTNGLGKALMESARSAQLHVDMGMSREFLVDEQKPTNIQDDSHEVSVGNEKSADKQNKSRGGFVKKDKSADKQDDSRADLADVKRSAYPREAPIRIDQQGIQDAQLQNLPHEPPHQLSQNPI